MEEIAKGLLCDVVFGGSQTSGDEHHIAPLQTVTEVEINVCAVVSDDVSATHVYACGNEHLRHTACVSVDYLSNKQFVAYVEYCCFHDAKILLFFELCE